MAPPLLVLQNTGLTFGGKRLLDNAELAVGWGDRLCLVGRNGSGKSTLLKIAAGLVESDTGSRFVQPDATIQYLPQEPDLTGFSDVLSFASAGLGPTTDRHKALYLLQRLGLTGREDPANLSGGEARRAALARVLAPEPDIILLDEPTNHLDLPAIEWLENELAGRRSALVLISHDRRFLSRLSQATIWLDRGLTRRLERGFADFEVWRDELLEQEERDSHKLGRRIAMEEDWIRYGVTARRKRNRGRLERLQSMRLRRVQLSGPGEPARMKAADGNSSGALVIEAKKISKSYADRSIVRDFSIRIKRGDRVGVVGPNGAGKTTLVMLLTGELAPDSGSLRLGTNLEIAWLDQRRAGLDPQISVQELLGGGADQIVVDGRPKHVIGYMRDFLFSPEQARTPLGKLSGGERGRLALAQALALPSNLMVLDEPTNDLDLETLDLLQDMLGDYQGTVIVVSHDRDFLDRVSTSVIVAEEDGHWQEYAGGYSDMVAQRGFGVAAASAPTVPTSRREASPERSTLRPKIPPTTKRRLSFKDKHALETLPARIEALRAQKAALQEKLADPLLYERDAAAFDDTSRAFVSAGQALAAAEDQWLELEIRREEIEQ
jgi:ABC transport system ATP-binding/permease protein